MTSWSPNRPVPPSNPLQGASGSATPSWSVAGPAAATAPLPTKSSWSSQQPSSPSPFTQTTAVPKKSYSMTTWSPNKTVPPANPLQSGSGGGSSSTNGSASPSWSSAPAPATLEPTSYISSWSTPPSSSAVQPTVRKSYAMTTCRPTSPYPPMLPVAARFYHAPIGRSILYRMCRCSPQSMRHSSLYTGRCTVFCYFKNVCAARSLPTKAFTVTITIHHRNAPSSQQLACHHCPLPWYMDHSRF
jgi:hypothetical protein